MQLGLIVKVSKLCNLRCAYCCETTELGDRARISVDNIRLIFGRVREFLQRADLSGETHEVTFYWHGGEPFAQPIAYWRAILEEQRAEFVGTEKSILILNAVQSNLTLIRAEHLPLLEHFRLGFSFDVFNSLRVDAGGKATDGKVRNAISWLSEAGVPLAGIVVVTPANLNSADEVAYFFIDRGMSFRFIHLDEGLEHLPQVRAIRVPFEEYLEFAGRMYADPRVRKALAAGLRIDPISLTLTKLELQKSGYRSGLSQEDCAQREHLLEINTDGQVFSVADYPYRNSYGSIFTDSIESLLTSPGRAARIARSRERLATVCRGCLLYRSGCNGTFVSHATEDQYAEYLTNKGCEVGAVARMIESNVSPHPTAGR